MNQIESMTHKAKDITDFHCVNSAQRYGLQICGSINYELNAASPVFQEQQCASV